MIQLYARHCTTDKYRSDSLGSSTTFISTSSLIPGSGTVTTTTISLSPGRVIPGLFLNGVVLTSAGLANVTVTSRVAVSTTRSGVFGVPAGCLPRSEVGLINKRHYEGLRWGLHSEGPVAAGGGASYEDS
jgi:hypothetical protein